MSEKYKKPLDKEKVFLSGIAFEFKDIQSVIHLFYTEVSKHKSLQVPFSSVEDWDYHINKLSHFWWCRFGGKPYMDVSYNPPLKHLEAGFNKNFLDEWMG